MRHTAVTAAVLILLAAACGPDEQDITDSLDERLRSVTGSWTGTTTGTNPIALQLQLQQGTGGVVSGTGTMKEANAASAVPVTVTGSYQRPALSLTIQGMAYEGRQGVVGTAQGSYTSVGGITTTLQLTAAEYSRALPILLQEN